MLHNLLKKLLIITPLLLLTACETVKKTYKVLSDPSVRVGSRIEQPSEYSLSIFATNRININPYADDSMNSFEAPLSSDLEVNNTEDDSFGKPVNLDEQDFADITQAEGLLKEMSYSKKEDESDNIIPEEKSEKAPQATPVLIRVFQLSEKSLFLSASYDELDKDNFKKTLGGTYIEHEELMIDPNQFRFFENKAFEKGTRYVGVIAYFNSDTNRQWRDVKKVKPNGEVYPFLIRVTENTIDLYKDN
ncbi:MAG: type VI secretion system lipoprotein TssJ [Pasteurella sp.]|nr:type VI secretion system lipoprotein TssJ [Pasteurella sp.]